jgi:hypothetical protein
MMMAAQMAEMAAAAGANDNGGQQAPQMVQ